MTNIPTNTYCYIWEFIVRDGANDAFEEIYGPNGDWVRLFRRGEGYIETELIRDQSNPQRYLTIDHWRSAEDYAAFRSAYDMAFTKIDEACAGLTLSETKLGEFTVIGD